MNDSKSKKMDEVPSDEAEIKALELEMKRLQLRRMKQEIDEADLRDANRFSKARMNGRELANTDAQTKQRQNICNHQKGGEGMEALQTGQGNKADQYAIARFQMPNGDIWQSCLRCHKTWKPPVREHCKDDAEYEAIRSEYVAAMNMPTDNKTSGGTIFNWTDNGHALRDALRDTNLN